jgi:6-pyruvoyl-tetrahydropterin synthase
MYSVAVKSHVMIAHSLQGEIFGPAQRLHGATFVVSAEFKAAQLSPDGVVIDIGKAQGILEEALEPLRYRNLDELEELAGKNTTTELLAHHIHGCVAEKVRGSFRGILRVVLEESHIAWGSFESAV